MSSAPSRPWSRSFAKLSAINRFKQSEDAGIKPGEDAQELNARHAVWRKQDETKPLRKDSGYSEQHPANISSVTPHHQRRTPTHRREPYSKNDSARMSNQHRPSSVSDASEPEPPASSVFSDYWERPVPVRCTRTATTTESTVSLTSRTTASTFDVMPDPATMPCAPGRLPIHQNNRCLPEDTNVDHSFIPSPLSSPSLNLHDSIQPFFNPASKTTPVSQSHAHKPHTSSSQPTRLPVAMSHENSSQGNVNAVGREKTNQLPCQSDEVGGDGNSPGKSPADSGSSKTFGKEPSTPPSERNNGDEHQSDHEDSCSCSSENHPETVKHELLGSILTSIRNDLVEQLITLVVNVRHVDISEQHPNSLQPPATASSCGLNHSNLPPIFYGSKSDEKHSIAHSTDMQDGNNGSGSTARQPRTTAVSNKNGRANTPRTKNTRSCFPGNKRKGGPGDSDDDDDDGSGDDDHGPPAPKMPRPGSTRRFACPYFQRDPTRAAKQYSCFKSGFKNIHKMKEHLHRVHSNPIECPRCYKDFSHEDELSEHLRALGPDLCQPSEQRPDPDAYNQTQARQLSDRMRGRNDIDKWRAIWMILFPHDDEDTIPEPWWTSQNPLQNPHVSKYMSDFERFTMTNLAHFVRPQIEAFVYPVFQELFSSQMDVILQQSLELVFTEFKQSQGAALLFNAAASSPVSARHHSQATLLPSPSASASPVEVRRHSYSQPLQLNTAAAVPVTIGVSPVTAVQQMHGFMSGPVMGGGAGYKQLQQYQMQQGTEQQTFDHHSAFVGGDVFGAEQQAAADADFLMPSNFARTERRRSLSSAASWVNLDFTGNNGGGSNDL